MDAGLTERQSDVLECIKAYIAAHGYPPTLREIGKVIGVNSTNGVSEHLCAIEKKGYIRRNAPLSRAMVVVDPPPAPVPRKPTYRHRAPVPGWKALVAVEELGAPELDSRIGVSFRARRRKSSPVHRPEDNDR